MKIGLALSGGGFRATVFHLGVLARLAEAEQLEDVSFLSTVSGGSLCIGLVHALNGMRWPTSQEYSEKVLPEARWLLTTFSLQRAVIFRVLGSFWNLLETRADDLSSLMQRHWRIGADLRDLPQTPRWMINATCYETGKNWRFERFRMGDYQFGYTNDVSGVKLADALAASAGFPGLVGPLVMPTGDRRWFKYIERLSEEDPIPEGERARKTRDVPPEFTSVHLWDGGVYDNHGLEALHNFQGGWREGVDMLIVGDAAGRAGNERYRRGIPALMRLSTGIMMNQVRSLRSRAILERILVHHDRGAFLQTGNTARSVLLRSPQRAELERIEPGCLSETDATAVAEMGTDIERMAPEVFERTFRHGFEVADYTLFGFQSDLYPYLGYANTRWG